MKRRMSWLRPIVVLLLLGNGAPAFGWVQSGQWPPPHQTNWRYDPTGEPPGVPGAFGAIAAAATTWTADPGSDFTFGTPPGRDAPRPGQPNRCLNNGFPPNFVVAPVNPNLARDNINYVGWADLGAGNTLAYTFVNEAAGMITEVDICFNNNPAFAATWFAGAGAPGPGMNDIETVALHEFGHAIGLEHPNQSPGLQRNGSEYPKVVMYSVAIPPKRNLLCDDKSGANFIYPPPGVVTEMRVPPPSVSPNPFAPPVELVVTRGGGCDFGDAPDPFVAAIGQYPSLENGEDSNNNGIRDPDINMPPPGDFPGPRDVDWNRNGLVDSEDINGNRILDLGNGARHKDSRMEWLGPLGPAVPASAILRAGPASATFEPESRQAAPFDELDDGVFGLFVRVIPGGVIPIDVLVNTSGVAGRYGMAGMLPGRNQRLYLNAWFDWNGNGIFGDLAAEQVIHWEGTPTVDGPVRVTGFFNGGINQAPGAPNARKLPFNITVPLAPPLVLGRSIFARFRLDYAENAGGNPQLFTDPSLRDIANTEKPLGEAKYGEVEDYPIPLPVVTSMTGSASRVGTVPPPGRDAGAKVGIVEQFTFAGPLDLTASTLTIHSLLNEVEGAGELLPNLPITLSARAGSEPDVAIFETPSRVIPKVRIEVQTKTRPVFDWLLRFERATIPTFPQLCALNNNRFTTNLAANFTIDDGINPPATVSTVQPWRCLDLINRDPQKPRSLRTP